MSPLPTRRFLQTTAAAILVALSTASLAHAEPAPPPDAPPQRPEGRDGRPRAGMPVLDEYAMLLGQLKLEDTQREQVRNVMQSTRQSLRDAMQDAQTMSPQDRLATLQEALGTMNGKISALLNDEQKKTFEAGAADILKRAEANFRRQGRANNIDGGATTEPATRPGEGNGGPRAAGGRGPGGMIAERVERALEEAGVTDEQKAELQPLLAEMREKLAGLMAEGQAGGDRQAMREKGREIVESFRDRASKILSAEQIEKVRAALLPNRGGGANGGGAGGANGPRNNRPGGNGNGNGNGDGGNMNGGDGNPPPPPPPPGERPAAAAPGDATPHANPEAGTAGLAALKTPAAAPTTAPAVINVGDPMPAFTLTRLDGRPINRTRFFGKPTVLIFGSHTAPSFRDHAALIQQLAKKYSSRVNWLILYTREMHPMGVNEPERNRDDHIQIAAHATAADRAAAARLTREALGLSIEVVPDAMDDALTTQLNGFPNAALLFDENGKLVARQQWAEPFGLERAIERQLKQK